MDMSSKLKLKSSVFVVPVDGRSLQVHSGERTLKMSGPQVELLSKVFDQLKVTRDFQEIVASQPDYPEESIASLLDKLESLDLIEDLTEQLPDGFSAREAAYYASQLQFLSHRAKDRFALQGRLKQARVTVIGGGRLGSVVASNLLGSGVGHLRVIDSRPVEDHDVGAVYAREDLGGARADVIVSRLGHINPFVELTGAATRLETGEDVSEAIGACDFVVVCEDDPAVKVFELANEVCLQKKIPWLGVSLSRLQGMIGPMVIPGETPCYRCYKLRERSNAAHVNDYISFEDYLRNNPGHSVRQGSLRPFDSIIGSLAALDVVYALTNLADPKSLGNLLIVDLLNLELESHPILRLPRCPSCSPARNKPKRKIYDI
ncbi:MAG: TOMM precursor leader peptide-binding protein [Acidobacteria bacterium]|nr:TOMM precursor leader peptide-binding protein [Acidobacteriota bacterium]